MERDSKHSPKMSLLSHSDDVRTYFQNNPRHATSLLPSFTWTDLIRGGISPARVSEVENKYFVRSVSASVQCHIEGTLFERFPVKTTDLLAN